MKAHTPTTDALDAATQIKNVHHDSPDITNHFDETTTPDDIPYDTVLTESMLEFTVPYDKELGIPEQHVKNQTVNAKKTIQHKLEYLYEIDEIVYVARTLDTQYNGKTRVEIQAYITGRRKTPATDPTLKEKILNHVKKYEDMLWNH